LLGGFGIALAYQVGADHFVGSYKKGTAPAKSPYSNLAIRLNHLIAKDTFLAGLGFLPALRAPLGFAVSGAGLLMFSLSIAFSLIGFLLAASCGRHK
jgi:hypothetical protein